MSFTVLSDSVVKKLLGELSTANATQLLEVLGKALVQYSCQNEQEYQPHRGVVARPDGQVSLFMPATTPETIGVKIVGVSPSKPPPPPPPTPSSSSALADSSKSKPPPPGLKSALTLCDASGQAFGVLNAAELTAFRTALGSMLLYRYRRATENVVVFGAGKQALWHIRLALLLRGADIRAITVVNRSRERTDQLVAAVTKERGLPAGVRLHVFEGRDAALEALVADADAIFCTTPATAPLFPAAYLASEHARRKTRYIAAIGSYRLDMQEVDPEFLRLVVDPSSVLSATAAGSATTYRGGVVAVDSRGGCLQEAGELVKAGISPDKMAEVGRLLHAKSDAGGDSAELDAWLENGLVVYKSVGVGIMDIAIGRQLLDLAKSRDLGVSTGF